METNINTPIERPEFETVAYLWAEFSSKIIPKDAPRHQYDEMKKAFYAGFLSCSLSFAEAANEDKSEEEAAMIMAYLQNECYNFFKNMQH